MIERDLDELEKIQDAYRSLEVLAGGAQADSENVGAVLAVLNDALQNVVRAMASKYRGSGDTRLKVIE